MSIRTVSLLAAVALAGLAVAALAQGGAFDPDATEAADAAQDAADAAASAAEEPQGVSDDIVYESYEVVQPIPDETPGPAARTIEPPTEEFAEAEPAPEPAAAPARHSKLIKLERIAQAPAASPARDKRVRIRQ